MNGRAAVLVLVAEDDSDIRELVARTLRRAGYDVALAADGAEALRLAEERPPGAAVLDVAMPGFDGLELTRRLRSAPSTATIPLVLLTAKARPVYVARGLAAGASGYVSKPFSPVELQARIDELLAA